MKGMKKATAALCLAAAAVPGAAQAQCWSGEPEAAATIRDLQSKLMVGTLQCRAIGIDILEPYNGFVRTNRETIQAANAVLKVHFAKNGSGAAQAQYDSFVTALANAYGAAPTNQQVCADLAGLAAAADAAGGDIAKLIEVAGRAGPGPQLPGGRCPITFATAAGATSGGR
jgi:hypothetical protein